MAAATNFSVNSQSVCTGEKQDSPSAVSLPVRETPQTESTVSLAGKNKEAVEPKVGSREVQEQAVREQSEKSVTSLPVELPVSSSSAEDHACSSSIQAPAAASTAPESTVEDESGLFLPSDFFIDEDVLADSTSKPSPAEKPAEKLHGQPKHVADQDIATILNCIMNNRAFLDDPVSRTQREKEDTYFKKLHGLKKEIKIRVKSIAELVVQRAVLGPVPVRTIRSSDRRAYYVGNVKIDEFEMPLLLQGISHKPPPPGAPPKTSHLGVKKARVLLPKVSPLQNAMNQQSVLKLVPPKEVGKLEGENNSQPAPIVQSTVKKKKSPFACPICPRTYVISQQMLDLHIAFHIDNARNLHCPVCGKAGTIWTNILKHYLSHPEIKDNASLYEMVLATCDKDRTMCGQCNTLFAMRNALIHHLQSSHIGEKVNGSTKINLVDEVRVKEAIPEASPKIIAEIKDANYLCPNCPYSTKTHYNLVLHSHECQESVQKLGDTLTKVVDDDLMPQFKCSLCGYSGVSSKQLEQHMHLHHGGSNTTSNHSATKPDDHKLACEFCPMKFRTSDQLRCHLAKHKDASMFHCKACNYKCRYKKIMHRHVHKAHPDMPLKGLIQAPKKGRGLVVKFPSPQHKPKNKTVSDLDESRVGDAMKDNEQEGENDDSIPTATVVVHTDENGELTVCDETEVSSIPLEPEQTTFFVDSNTLDSGTVTIDGTVELDSSAVTLDGSVLQILQGESMDCNGQPKVLLLSVGPSELESLSTSTFTIAEQSSNS